MFPLCERNDQRTSAHNDPTIARKARKARQILCCLPANRLFLRDLERKIPAQERRDHFLFRRCLLLCHAHTSSPPAPFPPPSKCVASSCLSAPLAAALLTPRRTPAAGNDAKKKGRKNRDEKDESRKDDNENDGVERDGPCLVSPRQLGRRSGRTGAQQLGHEWLCCFWQCSHGLDWDRRMWCCPPFNQPCSIGAAIYVTGAPLPDPDNCAALWQLGYSAYSQTLSLTPGSETPGLYAFEAYFGCFSSGGGSCTFYLTIGGTLITLSGTTSKLGVISATYTPVTATGISITNPNAVVSIDCVATESASCYVTRATLTQQGGVIGDPHFVGLDGQRFDLQGAPGSAYSLLSDFDLQVCVSPLSFLPFPSPLMRSV